MYLSSFSLVEPEDKFYFYQPSWLNAWEAHLFNKALKSTHANGWGLKRFGTQPDLYPGEMIRNPHYQKYLEAMEKAADDALMALPTKERMGNDSNLLIVFYVQIMPDDFVMQLHR
ncbi:hypothetical protein M7987_21510, partial [Enterobacter hormaechei subsp. xiangfangensis]|nr:hypothetical protein [Enterobacter hormaechei]MCW4710529.1 hypothetical protein [Enterobacter hormaechei subsp. xiangfangensis]MCM8169739.1 hypothetical protein [Enterobacter hormaechei]MCM8222158.1 hypothetical protein [Enterobacter hormaechei]MCW4723653.1 hypothetical protein [Enterobacter hormaechei subsp. xiangfangensis]